MTAPAKTRAKALDLLARGFTRDDVARKVNVSERTVYRWQRAADAEAVPSPKTPDESPASERVATHPRVAPVELTKAILHESMQGAAEARRDGNLTAASRLLKNAHGAAHDLQRAERESKANADVVTLDRAELDRARANQADMLHRLREDFARCGLACATCARSIRVWLASDGASGHPPLPLDEGSISPAQGIAILQALGALVRHSRQVPGSARAGREPS